MEIFKINCDPKCMEGSTIENLKCCIKSNVMCLFVNNSVHQTFLDKIKEERLNWIRYGGGY